MPEPDTTPDADRQARCDAIRDLITRVGRGRAGPDIATHLANYVNTELADGDQARAQRDTAAASLADLRNDLYAERRAHEAHRLALSEALSLGTSAPWDAITERAQTVQAAATERADLLTEARDALEAAGQAGAHGDDWPAIAPGIRALAEQLAAARAGDAPWIKAYGEDIEQARRGEAEAVRAREAAEQGERRAMEQRQEMAAERYAWQERGDKAERERDAARKDAAAARVRSGRHFADARRNRDAWRNARRRARVLSAEVTRRAPLLAEYAERAIKAEQQVRAAETLRIKDFQRASRAEISLRAHQTAITEVTERAEQAEAELARIRGGLYRQIRAAANTTVGGDTYDRPARAVRDFARDLETRLPEDTASAVRQGPTCGEPGWAEQERARMERLYTAAYSRAERAEAALTAVRKAVADAKACGGEDAGCTVDHRDIITALIDNGAPTLGDPQPATEPEPKRDDVKRVGPPFPIPTEVAKDLRLLPTAESEVREQPAEPDWPMHLRRPCGEVSPHPAHRYTRFPYVIDAEAYGCPGVASPNLRTHVHVSVTPQQVRDAVRHIIRTDRIRPRDVL